MEKPRAKTGVAQPDRSALEECTDVSGNDMVERVVKEEERAHLWKAVDGLPDVYRIPILLYYMENQNVASIAKLLSIPQGTVKSRLYKARKLLKTELEDYFL